MANIDILLRTSDYTGMPVISAKDGKQMGKVSDVVLDPKEKAISAFLVGSDNPQQAQAFKLEDISEIVSNVIFVKNEKAVKQANKVVQLDKREGKVEQFASKKVVSNKGRELGQITDLYFDARKGKVKQVEYKTNANGKSKNVRLQAKEIKFKQDFVEVKPKKQNQQDKDGQNPIQEVGKNIQETVQSIKEKVT